MRKYELRINLKIKESHNINKKFCLLYENNYSISLNKNKNFQKQRKPSKIKTINLEKLQKKKKRAVQIRYVLYTVH